MRQADNMRVMPLSVCIISFNEAANIRRTLASVVDIAEEIIIVDSGSTDETLDIARSFGAKVKVYSEPWKGFAAQKNSSIQKATCDWVLLLDADESLTPELRKAISGVVNRRDDAGPGESGPIAYTISRRNLNIGRWIRHAGYYPDPKLRLVRRGSGWVENRAINEELRVNGPIGHLDGDMIHHWHHSISDYMEHVNRYSSLGAEMKGPRPFSVFDIVVRPAVRFVYDYFFRLGFLDGPEGLLAHLYRGVGVSLRYAKAWELGRTGQKRAAANPLR
jgi:glycosyltransferase involved in cell wall biosynthesis